MSRRKGKRHLCALCGMKLPKENADFVTGLTGLSVCKSCIKTVAKIQTSRQVPPLPETVKACPDIMLPQSIIQGLDRVIIGQAEAKQAIALTLWKQQLRAMGDVTVPRSPLLLYGPTGCGKTALVREASRLVDLPCVTFDATTLSEAGYKGRDAQDMVKDLFDAHPGHKKLPYGVIFLDEVDKLAARGSMERAAYSRGTQHSLLKLVEGMSVPTPLGVPVDSGNLQFIFGGAFTGLDELAARRGKPTRRIGFNQSPVEPEADTIPTTEDFISYGMEPEFLGRITRKVRLNALSKDDLRHILLDSEISILKRYKDFFQRRGVELRLPEEQIDRWIAQASDMGTGARGLQTVVEQAMEPMLLRLAEHKDGKLVIWDAG